MADSENHWGKWGSNMWWKDIISEGKSNGKIWGGGGGGRR